MKIISTLATQLPLWRFQQQLMPQMTYQVSGKRKLMEMATRLIYIVKNQEDLYSSTPRFNGIVLGALDKHGREIETEHEGIKVLRDVRFEWLDWMDAGDGELGHVYDLNKDKEYLSGDGNSLNLYNKTLTVETCGWWCSSQTWKRIRKSIF